MSTGTVNVGAGLMLMRMVMELAQWVVLAADQDQVA
jgi:hypothetical protein